MSSAGSTDVPGENQQAFWVSQRNFDSFFNVLDERRCLALLEGFNCPALEVSSRAEGDREKGGGVVAHHSASFSPAVGPPNQMA